MMNRALLYGILKNKSGAEISASGNPAVLEGTVEGRAIKDAKIYGWSRQKTTTGAQLFEPVSEKVEVNGITVAFGEDAEVIRISGTATANTNFKLSKPIQMKAGDIYVLKMDNPHSLENIWIQSASGVQFGWNGCNTQNFCNITVPASLKEETECVLYGGVTKNSTYDCSIEHLMINAGSKSSPWEPYTGGQPSPNPEYPQDIISAGSIGKINIGLSGRNLLPLADKPIETIRGLTWKTQNGVISVHGDTTATGVVTDYYLCGGSGIYEELPLETGNITVTVRNLPAGMTILVVAQTDYKILVALSGKSFFYSSFTHVAGEKYRILIRTTQKKSFDEDDIKIMLNAGTEIPSWQPYHEPQSLSVQTPNGLPGIPVATGGNYTDADGQRWIADYIDLARGKLVRMCFLKRVGPDEKWQYSTVTGRFFYVDSLFEKKYISEKPNVICTHFVPGIVSDKDMIISNINDTSRGFAYKNSALNGDMTKWKSFLTDNEVYILGKLATPIEHDLTQEELEAYKNLTTCAGTTIVENDQDCYMEVSSTTGDTLRAKKLALLLGD